MPTAASTRLAIDGGDRSITQEFGDLFHWPIVTRDDEQAVLEVLHRGAMSGTDVTRRFEAAWSAWSGSKYALACCNGTASLNAAMWACGVGAGDEIICPSTTYWASCAGALMLGAAINFCDIDPVTLCIDPKDIEHRIGPKTKAIVVVHYAGHPCDMDPIMEISRRRGVPVIEDVSHAHGSLYKGRMCGTIGDIAGMSMMAGKGFAVGEGGMMTTDRLDLYERCIAFGHYERTGIATRWSKPDPALKSADLALYSGIAMGGTKHRINQTCSAMGLTQLAAYPARIIEIRSAMDRFWSLLEGVPGIRPHRVSWQDSTMGPWYFPQGILAPEALHGADSEVVMQALLAEGVPGVGKGGNAPLHLHNLFHSADLFHMGSPTMVSFGQRDVRQGPGSLPVAESIRSRLLLVPWFKHDRKAEIEAIAAAFRKVLLHLSERPRG